MGQAHHHHHLTPDAGDRRVGAAIAVNFVLTVAQVIGGVLSGSLALIADALHNLSDALSLVIALAARKVARRPADARMTFGYARAEVVAALINYTTLIVIGLYLGFEAVTRFFDPQPVAGWIIIWIAGLALAVDAVTAALTYRLSKQGMNIRAAFLHNMADAAGSVGVIVAGVLILLFGWIWVDPVVTLMIAGYILWMSLNEIGGSIRILMMGAPPEIDTGQVISALKAEEGVADVHSVHLWQMHESEAALEAHVVVASGAWDRADAIKERLKARARDLGITHTTLEVECTRHACPSPQVIGHG